MEEENKEEKKEQCLNEEIKELVESKIKDYRTTDINVNNLEVLYKLIDILKDLENIEYWKFKKEVKENEIRKL